MRRLPPAELCSFLPVSALLEARLPAATSARAPRVNKVACAASGARPRTRGARTQHKTHDLAANLAEFATVRG